MESYSNKIANLFEETFNLKKGDCVALFMENKPEVYFFVIFFFSFQNKHQIQEYSSFSSILEFGMACQN